VKPVPPSDGPAPIINAQADMTDPVSAPAPATDGRVSEKLAKFLDRLDTEMVPQRSGKPTA